MSAGASPQTPLGELTGLPRPCSWFQGAALRQEGNKGEGRGGLGERGMKNWEGRGKGEWGREGKGGSWGNSALVVGG